MSLVKLDREKDNVLAAVSHDLRAPLNLIKHLLKEVQSHDIAEELKEQLQVAAVNADLLLFLIQDILDFSLIKEKKIRFNFDYFNLEKSVQEVQTLIQIQAQLKNTQLVVKNKMKNAQKPIFNDAIRLK